MKYLVTTLSFCLLAGVSYAQASKEAAKKEGNLIVNGGFETFEGKLKKVGQFSFVKDWSTATQVPADLYSTTTTSELVTAPRNFNGEQAPYEGETYAGIVGYSYRNTEPRSYLTTRMTTDLVEGQMYCLKYKMSLADLSKYAINNMGIYFSKHIVDVQTDNNIIQKEIYTSGQNEVVKEMEGWYHYCKIIQGKGFERYLTIGNFSTDETTTAEKVKRPTGFTAVQRNVAYYYIDDVSVTHIQYPGECDCSDGKVPESKIVYSKSSADAGNLTLSEQVENSTIYFYQFKPDITSTFEKDLDNLVKILNENKLVKLKVISHVDNEEFAMGEKNPRVKTLCNDRVTEVVKYFQTKGIDRGRIITEVKENTEPASEMNTALSLAKNRRVEFRVSK
jgi:outer membrane protein OmpA-like peptidoglycan-associated protein